MSSRAPQPLVLEYKQRRYDGGVERDMIEQIEQQYKIYEQQQMANGHGPMPMPAGSGNPIATQTVAAQRRPQQQQAKPGKLTLKDSLYKAFIVPYVELVLGLSGVLIGNIIGFSFMKGAVISHDALRHERQALLMHSWSVVGTSLLNILTSPWKAVRLCMSNPLSVA